VLLRAGFEPHELSITKRKNMKMHTLFESSRRAMLVMLALGAAALTTHQVQAATAQPPIPKGVAMKSWQDNGSNGQYVLQLLEGKALSGKESVNGKVASDSDCTPDADGLSHCHNIIELANGQKMTVVDTHNMHINRCLSPGEQISLKKIDKTWMLATLFKK